MPDPQRARYHHGNLRSALVATALEILERSGPSELSLRKLAAAAGVTRGAPYAHFRNKRELLHAISDAGFDQLAGAMAERDASASSRDRFLQTGRGYVAFALRNPNLFRLMFSAELAPDPDDGKTRHAFDLFRDRLADFLRENAPGIAPSPALETMAWSLVHGLAILLLDNRLPGTAERHPSLIDEVTALFADQLEFALR
jgi:AcrR family transcriptional regulator